MIKSYQGLYFRLDMIGKIREGACREHGKMAGSNREAWAIAWNLTFLGEMDRLAREVGLIK